jgi:hypothetical protein
MSLQTVHIRVNDAATGQPTPVRLRVTDSAGVYYAPFGHAAEFPVGRGEAVGGDVMIGNERWAYIDGTCEIALPTDQLIVEVRKGPEYRPIRDHVHLPAGKLALRFAIERDIDLRQSGWFAGDTRAHFLPPHATLIEAAAEDLAVVYLLAHEHRIICTDGRSYDTHPNLSAFSGQRPCLECDGSVVCVGTRNNHAVLGALGLLHCHRVVYPLHCGQPNGTDDWLVADWCNQCHRKGGLAVWADAFSPWIALEGEVLADLILGDIDALELDPNEYWRQRVTAWYSLLRAGMRCPLVGASAKVSNETPLGAFRTYAQLTAGEPFDLGKWIEAVRAGRTVISAGPFLKLEVDGRRPGQVIRLAAAGREITASFAAIGAETGSRVELLANGQPAASSGCGEQAHTFQLPVGGWIAARIVSGNRLLAHTSPIYVEVEGVPPPIDPAAVEFLDGHLQRTREWIVTEGRFTKPKSRGQLLGIIDQARQKLSARAGGSATIAP